RLSGARPDYRSAVTSDTTGRRSFRETRIRAPTGSIVLQGLGARPVLGHPQVGRATEQQTSVNGVGLGARSIAHGRAHQGYSAAWGKLPIHRLRTAYQHEGATQDFRGRVELRMAHGDHEGTV